MRKFENNERRNKVVQDCEMIIEIAVNYYRTIGATHALAFLAEHGISSDVAVRVTSLHGARRKTLWERHPNETALRSALGARPLVKDGDCSFSTSAKGI